MAVQSLLNQANITGEFGDKATPISFSSNQVETSIVDGLTVTKVADKVNWIDGALTYTLTITNNSGENFSNGSLVDKLDTTLVDFNTTYGVQINGSASTDYTYESGTLTITLPKLETDNNTIITFQVTRKQ